jgi:hypothetical protein
MGGVWYSNELLGLTKLFGRPHPTQTSSPHLSKSNKQTTDYLTDREIVCIVFFNEGQMKRSILYAAAR